MRRSDAVRIRRQFRAYSKPSEDIQVGDLCYAAVLPAVGNSRKLMLDWSGPVKVIEIINNAQLKVIETNVNKPRTYIAHRSKLRLCKKMGEKDINPIFRLPRLPRDVMLQLEDELSGIELPCLVENDVMDEFHVDPVHHGAQRQDDDSSLDSTKTESSKNTSTGKDASEEEQEQESEDEDELQESEDEDEQFQSFVDQPENPPGATEDERLSSAASEASRASNETELRIEAEPEKNGVTSVEHTERLSLTTSETSGASSEAELRIEAEPEKNLMITEQEETGTVTRRRSERVKTPVDRFDPGLETPRESKKPRTPRTPRTPRKTTARSRPSLPTTLRETGSRILSSIITEAWEQRPLGPPRQPRSVSRTSTRTRAASLEKMQRTGSIKINQSISTKSVSRVEDRRSRSESRSESRSRSRAGSRDRWGNGLWTDNEDDNQDRDRGGIHVIKDKSTLVAKIKDTMTLQPRTGKWIPVNCKLDSKSNNNFLYPIIFNSFIERNVLISKFSPQAGATRSPAVYMYNSNDFFVQVRKGDSVARLISLEVKDRGRAEDRRMRE